MDGPFTSGFSLPNQKKRVGRLYPDHPQRAGKPDIQGKEIFDLHDLKMVVFFANCCRVEKSIVDCPNKELAPGQRAADGFLSIVSRGKGDLMSSAGLVTHWIGEVKEGDTAAAQRLWEAYYQKLVRRARNLLGRTPRRVSDEEDVALSAFKSFFDGLVRGMFPQLSDRHDLWRLLVRITACKAIDQINHERRKKRCPDGAAFVQDELAASDLEGEGGIAHVVGPEPTPEFAVQVAEEYERLIQTLDDDPQLRAVAEWKMEGFTEKEIAGKLDCAVRTVERKLNLIRSIWKDKR
jgi:DNA-directed RNA polymerase specialized sigma24 family protein